MSEMTSRESISKPRVVLVAGARPNFIKIAPLMRQLLAEPHRADVMLLHTGQHYDDAMSRVFFEQLQIPTPDVNLEVGGGSHARQTAQIMTQFEPVLLEWKPDVVVVVGDVNSTIACTLVAVKLGIRVAHVEAGLRSFDRTMPEEINRLLTDAVSDYLFVSEPSGVTNLRREGVAEDKIFLVGNVMIDSLQGFLPAARATKILAELGLSRTSQTGRPRPYLLVTLHRPSNVDRPETLRSILEVLRELARDTPVIFPAHPRTKSNIERFGLTRYLSSGQPASKPGLWLLPPVGYLESLHLMSEAAVVLTDSGGMQEETTALAVPCLTLRDSTERPITVDEGTNTLIGTDPHRVLRETRAVLTGDGGKRGRIPALWDGRAGPRIVSTLLVKLQHSERELTHTNG